MDSQVQLPIFRPGLEPLCYPRLTPPKPGSLLPQRSILTLGSYHGSKQPSPSNLI